MKQSLLILSVAVCLGTASLAAAAESVSPFTGERTAWHGFDRYDFLMDEQSLAVKPFTAGMDTKGQRRCIVVRPKEPAAGAPWSWRGCYWDHEPQTEIELLKRGFHICYITADASLKPDKRWDAWYEYLTAKCGLSKKPAFIGMSRGGEYSYIWATTHPDKVACIYGDNPGGNSENLARLEGLARNDVPVVHVCGTIDPILEKYSTATENFYHQFGGRISVLIKEGAGHHPHSLRDPKFLADFIEQSVKAATPAAPAVAGKNFSHYNYYSLDEQYVNFPSEKNYLTCRGPLFTECYDRYDAWLGFDVPVTIILPKKDAAGKPWVFRTGFVDRDAVVDQGLLAKGFAIVVGTVGYNSDGPDKKQWDSIYKHMTDNGYSKKPVLEGAGGAAGEMYAWAVQNPGEVACIYAENPVLRSHMQGAPPIMENLGALAKAGVPIMHVCGSKDPWLAENTQAAEKKYKELGGHMTVIIKEGDGHYPLAPKDPKAVVDFIAGKAASAGAVPFSPSSEKGTAPLDAAVKGTVPFSEKPEKGTVPIPAATTAPRGAPKAMPAPRSAEDFLAAAKPAAERKPGAGYTGQYFKVYYPGLSDEGELRFAVTYTLWIPDGVKTLRGLIVHQHGAGMTASKEGSTAAFDLQWQALAKKYDCAYMGPCYHVLNDGDWDAAGSIYWMDPRRGSEKTFLKALDDLAAKSGHAELSRVPWALWGHSAGGIWSDIMSTLHPDRVVGVFCRSGSQPVFADRPLQVPPTTITPAACGMPVMLSCGKKEGWITDKFMMTLKQYQDKGGLIGMALDPLTDHNCGESRDFAIRYLDACLSMRLPDKDAKDQALKPVDAGKGWLAALNSPETAPAAEFKGNAKEATWLPSEAVAKAYAEYIKTGYVTDTTPPPAPFNVKAVAGDKGTEVTWSAEADLGSGIGQFIVMRDGQELAKVPEKPKSSFGRAMFQGKSYHDTPERLTDMKYVDSSAKPGEKHAYAVIEVNGAGLKSKPAEEAK